MDRKMKTKKITPLHIILTLFIAHIIITLIVQFFGHKYSEIKSMAESITYFQQHEKLIDTTSFRKSLNEDKTSFKRKYLYPNKNITVILSDNIPVNIVPCFKNFGFDILSQKQIQEKANLTGDFQFIKLEKYVYNPFFIYIELSRNYSINQYSKHSLYYTPIKYRNFIVMIFGYSYYSTFTILPIQNFIQKK
jgi:hypothetical protein